MLSNPPATIAGRARGAAVTAARQADDAARDGRLSQETVAGLVAAGFPRHFVPSRWGGGQGSFVDVFLAAADVAEGCASAAWCAVLWAAHGRFAALLPEEGQEEIWGESADVLISAAVMPPAGSAERLANGWLLAGEWATASGVDHADWLLVAAPEPGGPVAASRVFAVPRHEVTIRRTWNSTGLRGTGSNGVVVEPTLVPHHRSVPLAALLNGADPDTSARCHAVPAHLAGGLMFCAPALGAARRAVALWTHWAARGPRGSRALDRPLFQERLARSSSDVEAVELMLREAAQRADEEPVTGLAVARNRRDAALGVERLLTAVDRLVRSGGAHLRDPEGELHRCWADVMTVASHGALQPDAAAQAYAEALGAEGVLGPA